LRSNTKGYGGITHQTDSQNSDTSAPIGRELYHLQFSLQAASPETFGYTLVNVKIFSHDIILEDPRVNTSRICKSEYTSLMKKNSVV
jgi:hypothetical protein